MTEIYAILAAALLFAAFGLLRPRGCGGACDGARCGACPTEANDEH